jgi:hypothetical protein
MDEWKKNHKSSYLKAHRKGWFDKCSRHMPKTEPKRTKYCYGKWDFKACRKEALKFSSRKEWFLGHRTSYNIAQRRGWIGRCSRHMPEVKPRERTDLSEWTYKKCLIESLKHDSRTAWRKDSLHSYAVAELNGWLVDCTKHMSKLRGEVPEKDPVEVRKEFYRKYTYKPEGK